MLEKYLAIALSVKVNTQLDSCLNSMPHCTTLKQNST